MSSSLFTIPRWKLDTQVDYFLTNSVIATKGRDDQCARAPSHVMLGVLTGFRRAIEADHDKLKSRLRLVRGLKRFRSAWVIKAEPRVAG